jgi:hypothetical protein
VEEVIAEGAHSAPKNESRYQVGEN